MRQLNIVARNSEPMHQVLDTPQTHPFMPVLYTTTVQSSQSPFSPPKSGLLSLGIRDIVSFSIKPLSYYGCLMLICLFFFFPPQRHHSIDFVKFPEAPDLAAGLIGAELE